MATVAPSFFQQNGLSSKLFSKILLFFRPNRKEEKDLFFGWIIALTSKLFAKGRYGMKLRHLILAGMFVSFAQADDFSFTGMFTQDDDVQLFNFTVGALSTVTLRTWSYAGGTNAAGQVIASDGFDPILALFDATTGLLINQNDDGGGSVPADAETGAHFDTFLSSTLAPGTYTVSVMQFNNFANGPDLAAGFSRSGTGNFTTGFGCGGANFCDVTGDANDGHWAFDILNVSSATTVGSVPEPGSFMLLGSVALGLSIFAKKLRARA